jgi:membrane protein YdbS with pleckstrin-like domain
MRYLNMLLGLAMLGFVAVQYNDPDGWLWAIYYIVPAAWAFLAAFRLDLVRSTQGKRWLWACVAVWLGLVIFYWPTMPGFWRREVFMVEVEGEGAREGMGLMIAWATLLVAWFSARRPGERA